MKLFVSLCLNVTCFLCVLRFDFLPVTYLHRFSMSGSRHSIAVAAEVTISNWAAPGSTPSDVADVVLPNTVGS